MQTSDVLVQNCVAKLLGYGWYAKHMRSGIHENWKVKNVQVHLQEKWRVRYSTCSALPG
jgi:hypothetical protein